MKKTTTKLQLKKSTVRVLHDNELEAVHGGDRGAVIDAPTNTCSGAPTACSGTGPTVWGHGHNTKHCY